MNVDRLFDLLNDREDSVHLSLVRRDMAAHRELEIPDPIPPAGFGLARALLVAQVNDCFDSHPREGIDAIGRHLASSEVEVRDTTEILHAIDLFA